MTTGTTNNTIWVPIATSCSGADSYGQSITKTWNGADQTPMPKLYEWLKDPVTKRLYKKRVMVKRRKLDPHNYTMSATVTKRSVKMDKRNKYPAFCKSTDYTVNWSEAKSCFVAINPTWPTFSDNDHLKLLSKLQRHIYGSNFDPGIFLAESKNALHLIATSAVKLAAGFRHFRRGEFTRSWMALTGGRSERRRPAIDPHKGLSQGWSEFRWGWLPLVDDLDSGAAWLAHNLYAPVQFRISARRSVGRQFGAGLETGANGYRHRNRDWTHKKQIICYLTEPPHRAVLDLINPSTIAWELLPYSFVVDWAIPIGTYLNVRGLPSQLVGTFVTSDLDLRIMEGVTFKHGTCPTRAVDTSGNDCSNTISFNRVVTSYLPSAPKPSFRGFGTMASWLHAVDSLALLTNAFGKRRPGDWDQWRGR